MFHRNLGQGPFLVKTAQSRCPNRFYAVQQGATCVDYGFTTRLARPMLHTLGHLKIRARRGIGI